MAKGDKQNSSVEPVAQEPVTPEPITKEQLMLDLQAALTAGDYKAVASVSRQIDQRERATEKAELDAKRAALEQMSETVKVSYIKFITPIVESGVLDSADGIWISHDFGEQAPSVRLMKTTARAPRAGGGGTGKKFDISTDDMLSKYGEEPYKDSGMTFKVAYESNTDKNWRYAIRQALLKKEGII